MKHFLFVIDLYLFADICLCPMLLQLLLFRAMPHGSIHSPSAINFFKSIGASERVINILEEGYKIPFRELPGTFWLKNNKSCNENIQFVREKTAKWLSEGFVIKANSRPKFVSPISVDTKKAKPRMCLDCSKINDLLLKEKTKLPSLKLSESLIEPGDYAKCHDLTNAYFHVELCPQDWDKLAFAVPREEDENEYDFYYFTVLIYGITTATSVLNLITQPLIDFILKLDIKIVIYIDDSRLTSFPKQLLEDQSVTVKQIFNAAGFCFNLEKETESSQYYQFLGFNFDTRSFIYSVPPEKLAKITHLVNSLSINNEYKPSEIASIVGKLISCELACGLLPRLCLYPYFKWIGKVITNDRSWSIPRRVSKSIFNAIVKSLDYVKKYSGKLRSKSYHYKYINSVEVPFNNRQVHFVGDGNEFYGAYYKLDEKFKYKLIKFSDSERTLSSSYRELLVLHQCIKKNRNQFKDQDICYQTDSRVLHFWIERGSCNPFIADKLIDIFTMIHENNIVLDVTWCSRDEQSLQLADNSCKSNTDEFELPYNVFTKIVKTLDVKLTVDLFASTVLHKTEKFYTSKPSLGSSGADALKFDWGGDEVKWCFPPKNLMFKVYTKIKNSPSLNLVLVFLKTSGNVIFKLFLRKDGRFQSYIKTCLICDSKVFSPFFRSRFTISNHSWYVMHIVKGDELFNLNKSDIIQI